MGRGILFQFIAILFTLLVYLEYFYGPPKILTNSKYLDGSIGKLAYLTWPLGQYIHLGWAMKVQYCSMFSTQVIIKKSHKVFILEFKNSL